MNVSLSKDGKTLTVEMSVSPRPSKSGKTTLLASSGGGKITSAQFDGKDITVNLTAYVPKG